MYVPAYYRSRNVDDCVDLIRRHPFATIVTVAGIAPVISYLPCTIVGVEPELVIAAHFARANPHWKCVEATPSTLLFHGPHGYVSAGWYAAPHREVPTWNYAAVHVAATGRLTDDNGTRDVLERLTNDFERPGEGAWSMELAEDDFIASQLRAIVGVHFTATAIDAKFKLSQNRNVEDRDGAVRGLRATGRESDRELADLMDHISRPPLTV